MARSRFPVDRRARIDIGLDPECFAREGATEAAKQSEPFSPPKAASVLHAIESFLLFVNVSRRLSQRLPMLNFREFLSKKKRNSRQRSLGPDALQVATVTAPGIRLPASSTLPRANSAGSRSTRYPRRARLRSLRASAMRFNSCDRLSTSTIRCAAGARKSAMYCRQRAPAAETQHQASYRIAAAKERAHFSASRPDQCQSEILSISIRKLWQCIRHFQLCARFAEAHSLLR